MFNTKKLALFALFGVLCVATTFAQDNDPVLFVIEGKPVHVSEFKYIYAKTNAQKADFSEASLREYLALYTNFKLKVERARALKLDTIPALQQELAGYRQQLSNSYLIDKQVKDKLLTEAYERKRKDIEISHILVGFRNNNESAAKTKIEEALQKLDGGATFESIAATYSDDNYSKNSGGKVGFINAMFPSGFYNLETAAYETPVGKYSKPVRTDLGYHIVKVHASRPALGTVEVAHLLIRKKKDRDDAESLKMANAAYEALQKGLTFEEGVKQFSEDEKTKTSGGRLGFWQINSTEPVLLETAFALKKDGEHSKIVESSIGWHVIKRISRAELKSFEEEKGRIQAQLERDARLENARTAFVEKLKKENNYNLDQKVFDGFVKNLDKSFISFQWKAPSASANTLFNIAGNKTTLGQFTDFLAEKQRERTSLGNRGDVNEVAKILLNEFVSEKVIDYEKSQLEKKYPDFKALMREYEEGILLFEVTKMEVWDKAAQDTVGLQQHYDKNMQKYKWEPRAKATKYTVNSQSEAILKKAKKAAKKKTPEAALAAVNKSAGNLMSFTTAELEDKDPILKGIKWKKGAISNSLVNADNSVSFYKLEETMPARQKTLQEARGFVVADYQEQLEKQWVESLRSKYKVTTNEAVLKELVKK